MAQTNLQCQWINEFDVPLRLDSLSSDPSTFEFSSEVNFNYDILTSEIIIENVDDADSVQICYRTFPFSFSEPIATHSYNEYDSTIATPALVLHDGLPPHREEIFTADGIQKTGSISRGVSFGNNQDVFVNSSLNLQMEGKLTEDLNIRAAITDQNIPFQPEGNTQQLQDFDNVYIQLYNNDFSLTAGDVVLKNKDSQFLRYYKNVQGGDAVVNYTMGDDWQAESTIGVSVAKGKFASTQIEAIEGITGPYKLRGPDGERFIIVIANSEKVYVDGRLLKRGFNHDYVIDYNLGELTFNNNIVITRFTRIRVDFEYSDRNYNRSILKTSHYLESDKADFHFNFYQEKDNRNRPLAFDLSNADKQLLSDVGDNLDQAVISGADSAAFNENLVMYERRDTIDIDGATASIFVTSNDPQNAKFVVSFSEVGLGNGDYELLNTNTNGRVYRWVSPQNGQPQGTHAPVTQITPPSMKQMMTFGGGLNISKTDRIFSELAFSNQDINLFSDLNNDDNSGYALKTGYEKKPVDLGFLPNYKLSGAFDYEFDSRHFAGIDRFRYIEFNRDWSAPTSIEEPATENMYNASVKLKRNDLNQLNYHLSGRKRGNQVDGLQHRLEVSKSLSLLQLSSQLFLLDNDQGFQQSEWRRWVGEAYLKMNAIEPGYQYTTDRNSVFTTANDSIFSTLMNYSEHKMFVRSGDSLSTGFNINYAIREDKTPFEGDLVDNNRSQTANAVINTTIGDDHYLNVNFTYRNLENLRPEADQDRNEETIMGRLDWRGSFLDRHIKSELTYATNNSRELKREFIYLQVNTGEGTHTWRDLNDDGEQDLSEFFEAINFDERNYVKIWVPTDEFINAFSNIFNYRFSAVMPRQWREDGGLKALISKISNVSSVNLNKKITDDDIGARFLPFSTDINDEDLVSVRQAVRSTFFFNRANPGYAMDFGINMTDSKQLLTNGIESRSNDEYTLNIRYNLNRNYNFHLGLVQGEKANFSDFLTGRNFIINTKKMTPEIAWQPSNNFRLKAGYSYTDRNNIILENSGEGVKTSEYNLELRLAKAASSSLNATFRFINNDFEGDENSALGYELLNALRSGRNATWNINLQRKLANGLRINMTYEGRKSADQRVIHTGRMQVTALF
ncbi:MAG: hypothetical protein RJQ09_15880 [Cyclobacteriaceae bacterium]